MGYADSVSQILLRRGEAEARAELEKGQAWAGMAQQLGQIPGQVIQQRQQQQDRARQQADADQRRELQAQQIAGNKALEQDRLADVAHKQDLTKQDAALRSYFTDLGDKDPDLKAVSAIVGPERGTKIAEGMINFRKLQRGDYDDVQTVTQKVLQGFSASTDAQRADAYPHIKDALIKAGVMQPGDAPDVYDPQWYASRVAYGKEQVKATREIKTRNADGSETIRIVKDEPTATPFESAPPAITPEQKAVNARLDAAAVEAARHNKATEAQAALAHRDSQGDKTDLTPEGLDAAAMMFAKTGQLPALGNGDKTTRKAIINRAAALVPGLDVATAKADFGANTASLRGMQTQRDTISAFEKTAAKNIDLFLDQAGKVVDTGSPLANTLVRHVSGKMLGSPDQAAYEAARQVAVNEIAKITNGGGLSGVLSDSARKEIGDFNPQNATLKQTVAVMRLLKRDMANRASSMDDQIGAITDRIKKAGATPAAPPATGSVTVQTPAGRFTFPTQAAADDFKKRAGL